MPGSVGSIYDADLKSADVFDAHDPKWPFKAFAKHDVASSLRSISTISVARTWRISNTFDPTAGGEGCVTLHCGQPLRSPASLLMFVMPLRRRGKPSPDERLEKSITLQPMAKNASKALRYGPICRAGAHIVCVSLNGAHVVGSPLHVLVTPNTMEPTMSELRPSPSASGSRSDARGDATREIVVWLQLRDRYGNRCTREAAAELVERGELEVSVTRLANVDGSNPEQEAGYPTALAPAAGTDAAAGVVTWAARLADDADALPPAGSGGGGRGGGGGGGARGGGGGSRSMVVAADMSAESPMEGSVRGVVCLLLRVAHAGVHTVSRGSLTDASIPTPSSPHHPHPSNTLIPSPSSSNTPSPLALIQTRIPSPLTSSLLASSLTLHQVSASIDGLGLANALTLTVLPGPARAASSTAHDAIEGEVTAASRCIAGVLRRLRLVARDAVGNATVRGPGCHLGRLRLARTNP